MATNVLTGAENYRSGNSQHTQVFYATHNSSGNYVDGLTWSRKKYMYRSFISFSFGGKAIEDFDLIATIDGDRMSKTLSAGFEDLTTDYDVVDGQYYWGTRMTENEISFNLATDGITQNTLDDLINWFKPGVERELILAEHPNRAIMARVSSPLQMSVIPFEEDTTVMVAGVEYETKTTLYKGTIQLQLVMAEPYWYSVVNLFGRVATSSETSNEGAWFDVWTDATSTEVSVYSDTDALKIIKEDYIPTSQMLAYPVQLGNNLTVDLNFTVGGDTDSVSYDGETYTVNNPITYDSIAVAGVTADDATSATTYGLIGPLIYTSENTGVDLTSAEPIYLFYPGTAPCALIISFNFTPSLASYYINSPRNSYSHPSLSYDSLIFTALKDHTLKFTLPSALMAYNQVVYLFNNFDGSDLSDLRAKIRDNVNHKAARAWGIAVVDSLDSWDLSDALDKMQYFLYTRDDTPIIAESSIELDCSTGQAIGILGYRDVSVCNRNLLLSTAGAQTAAGAVYNSGNTYTYAISGSYYFSDYAKNLLTNNPDLYITVTFDYTISDVSAIDDSRVTVVSGQVAGTVGPASSIQFTDITGEVSGTYVSTFQLNSTQITNLSSKPYLRPRIQNSVLGATITTSNVKIEIGSQPTYWCTAPEDATQSADIPQELEDFETWGFVNIGEENVGDMFRSAYVVLDERNHFDDNGYVRAWSSASEDTMTYSYKVSTDNTVGLSNLYTDYKYMYY